LLQYFALTTLITAFATARFFYPCAEHRSCHEISQRTQDFYAIRLPCSVLTIKVITPCIISFA